eukprot:RCo050905
MSPGLHGRFDERKQVRVQGCALRLVKLILGGDFQHVQVPRGEGVDQQSSMGDVKHGILPRHHLREDAAGGLRLFTCRTPGGQKDDALQTHREANPISIPAASLVDLDLQAPVQRRRDVVWVPLNRRRELQHGLLPTNGHLMPREHQPSNKPRNNRCGGAAQPRAGGNTVSEDVTQRGHMLTCSLKRSLHSGDHQVGLISRKGVRPFPVNLDHEFLAAFNGKLIPDIQGHPETVISTSQVSRGGWRRNSHAVPLHGRDRGERRRSSGALGCRNFHPSPFQCFCALFGLRSVVLGVRPESGREAVACSFPTKHEKM